MATVAKKHQDKLDDLKRKVREWHDYFVDNYDRYHANRRFVYKSNLNLEL